ncbi:MAG: hypothetical protein Q9181_003359 [Wetmoreana brouardii]
MGKSRSATLILSYLLSTNATLTPSSAIELLRQARPISEPNPGFWHQLKLYRRMHYPVDVAGNPLYQRWCWEREKKLSLKYGDVPGSEHIVFEDEAPSASEDRVTLNEEDDRDGEEGMEVRAKAEWEGAMEEYRCRRCRTSLGNSEYLIPHTPRNSKTRQECAHLFLNPLSWMRPVLSEGHLEGRLECPNGKCRQLVGKYAWQGMKCSCGEWVVPGISVARGKVDVVSTKKENIVN